MRRLVAVQRELHGGETSQSDWSEDDEEVGAETDDPDDGLDHLSMAANGGLTDAEGAMSGERLIRDVRQKTFTCLLSQKHELNIPFTRCELNVRLR